VITAHPAMGSQNDGKSKFAHLLQPIRDLTMNWDIDLASELEDYLSDVRRHSFMCLARSVLCQYIIY